MESNYFQDYAKKLATGSTIKNVPLKAMREFAVPLPPIEEQARIVTRVDELMARIDEYEKLENQLVELKKNFPNDMKDAVLKAVMEGKLETFVKNDLSVNELLENNQIQPITVDDNQQIPFNWKMVNSKDISKIVVGATPSTQNTSFYKNGNIVWLPSGCCQDCEVTKDNSSYKLITEDAYNSCSTTLMPVDTVMIALTGATAGKVGLLKMEACGNQSIVGIFPSKIMIPKFIYYYLMSQKSSILSDCVGSAQPHISKDYIMKMKFPLPPIEEQQRIVDKLDKLIPLIDGLAVE